MAAAACARCLYVIVNFRRVLKHIKYQARERENNAQKAHHTTAEKQAGLCKFFFIPIYTNV
jgi:hypothetical protein